MLSWLKTKKLEQIAGSDREQTDLKQWFNEPIDGEAWG